MAYNQFEPFFILKEFQSLDKFITESQNRIQEEDKRIVKLKLMEESRSEDLVNHINEQSLLIQTLSSKELINLKICRDYEQTLASEKHIKNSLELQSFEQQKIKLENEKNKIEEELIFLLEKQDELLKQINDDKNFLSGLKNTISEITSEIEQSKLKEFSLIKDYEYRQSLLLDELPPHFKERFLRIYQNMKGKRPITIARGSNCAECAFLLSRNLLSELDRGETLVTCPNCHRLLLPSSATT
jgi:predicted  nucleic acid-binding Zn-ribbon protein